MTWHGKGASVLMLPALSPISTPSEMLPLQQRLGSWFTTLAIDWVEFGDRPRPPLSWSPEIYRSFLAYLLDKVVPRPFATIAAGHAAAYCLDAAAARPGSTGRLCLIAPTWCGPLPTMIGRKHPMFVQICRTVDWPVTNGLTPQRADGGPVSRRHSGRGRSQARGLHAPLDQAPGDSTDKNR